MSFKVPRPFLSAQGKPCIEIDETTLFCRVLNNIGRQWADHDVIGYIYAFNTHVWSAQPHTARQQLLEDVTAKLFGLAHEDRLTVAGLGPIMLLPVGNVVPADRDLASLLRVTQDTEFPVIAGDASGGIRALYQRAHVVAPLTTGP